MSQPSGVQGAKDAVLVKSVEIDSSVPIIKGYDFNKGINYDELIQSLLVTGYQASHVGRATNIINQMLSWRLSDQPMTDAEKEAESELPEEERTDRSKVKCTIFLGYTSNLISSGLREVIRFLAQHKLISCIVTTAGGVEEDFIKCLAPTYLSEFTARGVDLRKQGLNRIGNLVVPNQNYCEFENWLLPILDSMLEEQLSGAVKSWTPSTMIHRLGKEINNEESVYYWCYKNDIPVFCPAITDGSLGDMMFFHSINKPGLTIDILEDLRRVNTLAMNAYKSGMIILVRSRVCLIVALFIFTFVRRHGDHIVLTTPFVFSFLFLPFPPSQGSGIVKHHICNANLMRNGSDYAVYVNTAQEFDGSDAGASYVSHKHIHRCTACCQSAHALTGLFSPFLLFPPQSR
jgi:deoxyhypusine synthase